MVVKGLFLFGGRLMLCWVVTYSDGSEDAFSAGMPLELVAEYANEYKDIIKIELLQT